jgi:predicted transcriptional regulator
MTNAEKKKHACELFMSGKFSQEKIAAIVDVTPPTMSKWVNEEGWREARVRSNSLRKNIADRILILIEHQLEVMEREVEKQREDVIFKPLDKGQIDGLSKLFAGIKQRELTFTQQVVLLTEFLDFAQKENLAVAQQIAPMIELYIASKRQDHD